MDQTSKCMRNNILKFLNIFLLVLLSISAHSQVEVGVRSGVAISKQKNEIFGFQTDFSGHILGAEAGLFLDWFFLPSIFLRPELTFTQKGGSYPNGSNKINHIEAASLIGFERKCGRLSAFVNAGLFIDRVVGTPKDEAGFIGSGVFEYNDWGWGLLQSGGAAVQVGKGWMGLSGRYRYSLNYFKDVDAADFGADPDPILTQKNKGWSINLTYKIIIK